MLNYIHLSIKFKISFFILVFVLSCNHQSHEVNEVKIDDFPNSKGFDFPVGKPNARGYYNAQVFGKNNHLGDDWNGVGGGNTDLGDAIYAIADGYVVSAEDMNGGWGNVIRVLHKFDGKKIESLYAHCDKILVNKGDIVLKGDKIGTIGTANGKYLAHLHFEIRGQVGLPLGAGYSSETEGYLDPTKFINKNRNIE